MRNYFKFIVAVFGITIATFGTINVHAKKGVGIGTGGCDNSSKTCGKTDNGDIITGEYNT